MEERTTADVVQDVMDDIAAKREAAQGDKSLAEKFADSKSEQAQPETDQKKMDEITLKFGKGCVGDEFQGMPGYIRYASNDRVEKEVHSCFMDIAGPDACDLSQGGGQYFCKGLMARDGEGYDEWNGYLVQRRGCGDPVCRVTWERASKFGPHKNHTEECTGHDWEEWGPAPSAMPMTTVRPRSSTPSGPTPATSSLLSVRSGLQAR